MQKYVADDASDKWMYVYVIPIWLRENVCFNIKFMEKEKFYAILHNIVNMSTIIKN